MQLSRLYERSIQSRFSHSHVLVDCERVEIINDCDLRNA